MKAADLYSWLAGNITDAMNADVVVIDAEGFVHVVDGLYWDTEDARWVIRARFPTAEEDAK